MHKRIFTHKHLDLFSRHLFALDDHGIEYKKQKYSWNKINKIEVLEPLDGLGLTESTTFERLKIYLFDGKIIKVNSRILFEKNRKRTIEFISGENNIYKELKELLLSQLEKHNKYNA